MKKSCLFKDFDCETSFRQAHSYQFRARFSKLTSTRDILDIMALTRVGFVQTIHEFTGRHCKN
jgi:hypothetical protein